MEESTAFRRRGETGKSLAGERPPLAGDTKKGKKKGGQYNGSSNLGKQGTSTLRHILLHGGAREGLSGTNLLFFQSVA